MNRHSGKEERREEILNAAARVFARAEVGAATMDEVAQEAQLSKGGLYRHFRSKEELLIALSSRCAKALARDARAAASSMGSEPSFVAASAIARASVRYAHENSEALNLIVAMLALSDVAEPLLPLLGEYNRAVAELDELIVTTLRRGQQDGSVRVDVPAELLAVNLWGSLLGTLQLRRAAPLRSSHFDLMKEQEPTELVDIIMGAVRPV